MDSLNCPVCKEDSILCTHIYQHFKTLSEQADQQKEDLKTLANTWKGILKVLDLESANAGNIFLKIPKLISQVQRQPEIFNFISPEINSIIDKYADK